jgi:adenosylcobinamide-phosphate synthase
MNPPDTFILLAVSLAVEAILGYPRRLYAAIGHPVTWMGRLIGRLDAALNDEDLTDRARRRRGLAALALLLAVTAGVTVPVAVLGSAAGPAGIACLALLSSSLLAQRSLFDHVEGVASALDREGVAGGRRAVALIVGRDPDSLDEAGIARAAIESLAENFSDGVVAPAFWLALAGLPGAALYKAVNTADSMIGHRTPRHAAFGWASARLDDLVNLPASRLSGLLVALVAATDPEASAGGSFAALWRDARHHRSPNAGWPEAAMAGALGLRLAGPRVYGGRRVEDHWMGNGRAAAGAADIRRALGLYRRACALIWITASAGAVVAIWSR